eukprot:m.184444 g.184444  ORF g.184444 m.184444 type:complete len:527 (+) comp32189_c0_seq2:208-1788(+)
MATAMSTMRLFARSRLRFGCRTKVSYTTQQSLQPQTQFRFPFRSQAPSLHTQQGLNSESSAETTVVENQLSEATAIVAKYGPRFKCSGENISVLYSPKEFHESLKNIIKESNKRIVLSSLYLGNGDLEQELVDLLHEKVEERSTSSHTEPFQVRVHVDQTRGTRGKVNSASLLRPVFDTARTSTNACEVAVSMYHSPKLQGIRGKLLKSPLNEVLELSHMKLYIGDDTVILSGCNLSHDYFTSRQDRYIVVKDKAICDFFEELVVAVSEFSSTMTVDGIEECSLRAQPDEFASQAASRMTNLMITASNTQAGLSNNADTQLFPLVQMGPWDVRYDEVCTTELFKALSDKTQLWLATGYFNLPPTYINAIFESQASYHILTASPDANGFLGASGIKGHIPSVYTHYLQDFWGQRSQNLRHREISVREFKRGFETFHAKGLWGYFDDGELPSFTFIGSPNFGYRSTHRDLECQVAVFTSNQTLRQALHTEKERLFCHGDVVSDDTFDSAKRHVKMWVRSTARIIKTFF